VLVATRSPATEVVDCIDLVRVDGRRNDEGVVTAEVDAVVAQLHQLLARGATSVGVVTPFRAQADALEQAVLDRLTADDIEVLDLRIGTVHAFQGNERDVVVASLGIGDDARSGVVAVRRGPASLHRLRDEGPRPLHHHARPTHPGGWRRSIFAADAPPGPPKSRACDDPWTAEVDEQLGPPGSTPSARTDRPPPGRHLRHRFPAVLRRGCASSRRPDAHIDPPLPLLRRWVLREAYPRTGRPAGRAHRRADQPSTDASTPNP
jgi:hypothetical protein